MMYSWIICHRCVTSGFYLWELVKTKINVPLTWLLSQSHNWHDVVRHVKVWKHGQACQPLGQLVQKQRPEHVHGLVYQVIRRRWGFLVHPSEDNSEHRGELQFPPLSLKSDTTSAGRRQLPSPWLRCCQAAHSWLGSPGATAGRWATVLQLWDGYPDDDAVSRGQRWNSCFDFLPY